MPKAKIESLTPFLPDWSPWKVFIVRMYDKGIEPVEPNPFRFAVVAVIWRGEAHIKALCERVATSHMRAGARALATRGVRRLRWRHDGVEHTIKTGMAFLFTAVFLNDAMFYVI